MSRGRKRLGSQRRRKERRKQDEGKDKGSGSERRANVSSRLVAACVIIQQAASTPNFNINYKYLSSQQGNNLTITLAPSTVLNAKWG